MTDDKFAEFIQKTVQDYNRPPEAPRAEMWARIDAARAKRRGERELERQARPWVRWGLAAAAVLAVGVGIGRMTVPQFGGVPQPVASATDAGAPADDELVFQVAALDYLTRTDAFLSLFRSEARSGTADMQVAGWARDLLTTARLMIDSPMGDDPNLKELLEDLELILVQIAQYRSGGGTDELDFIEQGLEQRSLLLRIQAALGRGNDVTLRQGAI